MRQPCVDAVATRRWALDALKQCRERARERRDDREDVTAPARVEAHGAEANGAAPNGAAPSGAAPSGAEPNGAKASGTDVRADRGQGLQDSVGDAVRAIRHDLAATLAARRASAPADRRRT